MKKLLAFTVLIISILLISGCNGQIATPDNSEDKVVAPFVLDNVQSMRLVPEHKFDHMHEFVDLESVEEFELFITALNGSLAELKLIDREDEVKHEVFIQLVDGREVQVAHGFYLRFIDGERISDYYLKWDEDENTEELGSAYSSLTQMLKVEMKAPLVGYRLYIKGEQMADKHVLKVPSGEIDIHLIEYTEYTDGSVGYREPLPGRHEDHIELTSENEYFVSGSAATIFWGTGFIFEDAKEGSNVKIKISDELKEALNLTYNEYIIEVQ